MICDNLQTIGARIKAAEQRYERTPGSVRLLAVSKRHPVSALRECLRCGQHAFGENYAREMAGKAHELLDEDIEWHYIGPIQSNKTRMIAETAAWIHSIDRFKVAQRINDQLPADRASVNVCLQVNISNEAAKSGVGPNELAGLAEQVCGLDKLVLRGIMAIPSPEQEFARQREAFAGVRQAFEELQRRGFELDTLSMGMSADMEAAIAEGATIVRIGTAIFGPRN